MEAVGEVAERVPQFLELMLHRDDALPDFPGTGRRSAEQDVAFGTDEGHMLDGVVVYLARRPGPLGFLSLEEAAGVAPVDGEVASLVDHHGDAEGDDQDGDGEATGDDDPPDGLGGSGHRIPRAMRSEAMTSTPALTCNAE